MLLVRVWGFADYFVGGVDGQERGVGFVAVDFADGYDLLACARSLCLMIM